jgi:hypothetical protein
MNGTGNELNFVDPDDEISAPNDHDQWAIEKANEALVRVSDHWARRCPCRHCKSRA